MHTFQTDNIYIFKWIFLRLWFHTHIGFMTTYMILEMCRTVFYKYILFITNFLDKKKLGRISSGFFPPNFYDSNTLFIIINYYDVSTVDVIS